MKIIPLILARLIKTKRCTFCGTASLSSIRPESHSNHFQTSLVLTLVQHVTLWHVECKILFIPLSFLEANDRKNIHRNYQSVSTILPDQEFSLPILGEWASEMRKHLLGKAFVRWTRRCGCPFKCHGPASMKPSTSRYYRALLSKPISFTISTILELSIE